MSTWTSSAAGAAARDAVRRLLADTGREPYVLDPDGGPRQGEAGPLVVMQAARELAIALQRHVVEQALRARGAGEDWREVAASLYLSHAGEPDAAAAYLAVLGVRGDDPWWSPARGVLWTCSTCEEAVRDFGPECGGPDDRESGHAPTCSRHTAALVAWEALWR